MHLPQDTIVALATPPGPGGRAIVRLTGPASFVAVGTLCPGLQRPETGHFHSLQLLVSGLPPFPADLYLWPAPHSYTGQDVVELHLLSSPPLLDALLAALLQHGCRAAQPGEFTLRAFLGGKIDLTRAEAVAAVIDADDRGQLKQALVQLAGGLAKPLAELREDLLNLLADVEAGLDFADEDIHFIEQRELLLRLSKALALVTLAGKQLESRAVAGRSLRVVLAGRPNAGKSSLFNALTGGRALVSPQPGTTRDYLVQTINVEGVPVDLIDTPGWQAATEAIEGSAQVLGREQQRRADVVLVCVEAGLELIAEEKDLLSNPISIGIATKCDLAPSSGDWIATSAAARSGLAEVRRVLHERATTRREPALASSISRCKGHVTACLAHLRRAHAVALHEDPPEILALELRETLQQLGEMVGAVYTEDLLDRIFSRFCIGK